MIDSGFEKNFDCDVHLKRLRDTYGFPAAGLAVFSMSGDIVNARVLGERKKGQESVTITDLWDYGSIGKSMTSLMIARLVEQGVLRWDMTIAEGLIGFPDVEKSAVADVTLMELLCHRGGFPTEPSPIRMANYLLFGGDAASVSEKMIMEALCLTSKPANSATPFHYSNLGYGLAGAIASARSGRDYRQLIQTHVLEPMGMNSAGFGAVTRDGSQPVEHRFSLWRKRFVPLKPSRRVQNDLTIVRPSGDVHGTILDLATYGLGQLRLMADPVLKAGPLGKLYVPFAGAPEPGKPWHYAPGWLVSQDASARTFLSHVGSTGGSFCWIHLEPSRGCGIAFVANAFHRDWMTSREGLLAKLQALRH